MILLVKLFSFVFCMSTAYGEIQMSIIMVLPIILILLKRRGNSASQYS